VIAVRFIKASRVSSARARCYRASVCTSASAGKLPWRRGPRGDSRGDSQRALPGRYGAEKRGAV